MNQQDIQMIYRAIEEGENAQPYRRRSFYCHGQNVSLEQCNRCGALVGNEQFHDEWHARLDAEREQ